MDDDFHVKEGGGKEGVSLEQERADSGCKRLRLHPPMSYGKIKSPIFLRKRTDLRIE